MDNNKAICKHCEHCNYVGRSQTQCYRVGRKYYYCSNPKAKTLPLKAFGNKAPCFIGFGTSTYESPLAMKTAPKWCPKNNE